LRLALNGLFAAATPPDIACLARLDLAQPRSFADRVTAVLVRAALKESAAAETAMEP
jgi:hypothetical protein